MAYSNVIPKRQTIHVDERFIDECIDSCSLPVSTIENPEADPYGFLLMGRHGLQGKESGSASVAVDAINLVELVSLANHYATEPDLSSTRWGLGATRTLKMLADQDIDIKQSNIKE
jgi:hypothetical protein